MRHEIYSLTLKGWQYSWNDRFLSLRIIPTARLTAIPVTGFNLWHWTSAINLFASEIQVHISVEFNIHFAFSCNTPHGGACQESLASPCSCSPQSCPDSSGKPEKPTEMNICCCNLLVPWHHILPSYFVQELLPFPKERKTVTVFLVTHNCCQFSTPMLIFNLI